nr:MULTISPECIES: transposase [unclassified Okeania]
MLCQLPKRSLRWELLEPLLPKPQKRGQKPNTNLTEVVNGIFYIFYSGCHWRSLPYDLPPWQTVSTKCT